MKHYGKLTREEILEDLDVLAECADFHVFRDDYMRQALASLDFELANAMLRLGSSPNNHGERGDGYFSDLFEMFISERGSKGEVVLAMMKLLLVNGADPNFTGGCNFRAVDLAMSSRCAEVVDLLIAAGADKKKRCFI